MPGGYPGSVAVFGGPQQPELPASPTPRQQPLYRRTSTAERLRPRVVSSLASPTPRQQPRTAARAPQNGTATRANQSHTVHLGTQGLGNESGLSSYWQNSTAREPYRMASGPTGNMSCTLARWHAIKHASCLVVCCKFFSPFYGSVIGLKLLDSFSKHSQGKTDWSRGRREKHPGVLPSTKNGKGSTWDLGTVGLWGLPMRTRRRPGGAGKGGEGTETRVLRGGTRQS